MIVKVYAMQELGVQKAKDPAVCVSLGFLEWSPPRPLEEFEKTNTAGNLVAQAFLFPALLRQKKEDLCEFEASLVY